MLDGDRALAPDLSLSSADAGGGQGRPRIGRRWVAARPWLLAPALLLSVAWMALAGVSGVRLAILATLSAAVCGLAAAQALLARRGGAPGAQAVLLSLLASILLAAASSAVTGGLNSPYLVTVVGPTVIVVSAFGLGRQTASALALLAAGLVALALLPAEWAGPPFPPRTAGLLGLWAVAVVVALLTVEFRLLSKGLLSTTRTLRTVSEELLQDLAARRRELESMSSKVAHEIKNPLTALKSLLALEKAAARDERSLKRFEVMTSEVARMEAIVRDYLSFSKPLGVIALADVDLARLADDVVAVLEGRAGDAGVDLRREGKGAVVRGDERRLKEALLNLGQNALEATPAGGMVAISVDPTPEGARVVVRDSGSGISPSIMGKLGTSFVTTRDKGTGLGVAIARSIVTQHRGTLELENRAEGGAVATVTLPRQPSAEESQHGKDPAR